MNNGAYYYIQESQKCLKCTGSITPTKDYRKIDYITSIYLKMVMG